MKKIIILTQRLKVTSALALVMMLSMMLMLATTQVSAQSASSANKGSVSTTSFTRAQLLALSENNLSEKLNNSVVISDLVNATPLLKQNRQDHLFYLTVDQFNQADATRKAHILQHGDRYIIFNDANEIPKAEMSKQQFNSLSLEKRKEILNSRQFTITD